jgi:hypothetical protein
MAFLLLLTRLSAGLARHVPTLFLSRPFSHSTNQALAPLVTSVAAAE